MKILALLYCVIGIYKMINKPKINIPLWCYRCHYLYKTKAFVKNKIIDMVENKKYFRWPVYDPTKRDPRDGQQMAGFYWVRR